MGNVFKPVRLTEDAYNVATKQAAVDEESLTQFVSRAVIAYVNYTAFFEERLRQFARFLAQEYPISAVGQQSSGQ